jgi:hypothetical protein
LIIILSGPPPRQSVAALQPATPPVQGGSLIQEFCVIVDWLLNAKLIIQNTTQDSPPGQEGWHRGGEQREAISVTGLSASNHIQIF